MPCHCLGVGCRLSLEVGLDPPNDLHAEPQKGSRHHTRKSALLLHQRGKHLRRLHFHKSSSSSTHRTEEAADPFKKKANCQAKLPPTARANPGCQWKQLARTASETTPAATPNYFAPEMAYGASYDNRVDIWALGCAILKHLH